MLHRLASLSGRRFFSLRLQDKTCIVTGAGAGIGEAVARRFAQEGGKVAVIDMNLEAAQKVAHEINGIALQCDVSDEQQVTETVRKVSEEFDGVDVLVANAGIQHISPFVDLELKDWRRMMNVHLDGAFLFARECTKDMLAKERQGKLLVMGSVHSKLASVLKAPYVTAKHGQLGLVRALSKELGPHGISANLVCPGFVKTELVLKQIPEQAERLGISEEEVVKNVMLRDTVDGEFTTPEDIAETCLFVASHPNNSLTGQSFVVSHGWCMN
ncbi:MAG: hypothetical protein MHM6MM_001509 [Cercozoa sp. M6MM]